MKKTYFVLVVLLLLCCVTGSAISFDTPQQYNTNPVSLFLKRLGVTSSGSVGKIYSKVPYNTPNTKTEYCASLFNSSNSITTDVCFSFEDGVFFGDNSLYKTELGKASCVLSMTAYSKIRTADKDKQGLTGIMKSLGYENVKTTKLSGKFTDNHITTFTLGHKDIIYQGQKATLLCAVIYGTDGSIKQWSSNFDIGASTERKNHKGFDITSERVLKEIESYVSKNIPKETKPIMWITGHSRGGSVANLCAKKLGDDGFKCYAYTFGASKTTINKNTDKYNYIFNIANSDDIVTHIPMQKWGFDLYGITKTVSVKDTLKDKWSEKTGLKNYKASGGDLSDIALSFASCADSRDSIYSYRDDGSIYIGLNSVEEGELTIESLKTTYAQNALPYCTFDILPASDNTEYNYMLKINMQPAFLLQTTAAVMAGDISAIDFVTMLLPEHMEEARSAIIEAYFGGINMPHTPETYYVIAESL